MLLALDPSIKRCGLALFNNGALIRAGYVDSKTKGDITRRCLSIASEVNAWAADSYYHLTDLVVEWPPTYDSDSVAVTRSVVSLAGVCCAVAAMLDMCTVHSYLPKEWTGNTPKIETVKGAKTSPRAKKIVRRLSESEMEIWDEQVKYHDTIDAIGIGLHHLGRFDRARVFRKG